MLYSFYLTKYAYSVICMYSPESNHMCVKSPRRAENNIVISKF